MKGTVPFILTKYHHDCLLSIFFFTFYFICIPSFRNKSLKELRLEKEHAFQVEQMRLENERHREEREHELTISQLLLENQVAQPIAVPPVAYAQQYRPTNHWKYKFLQQG